MTLTSCAGPVAENPENPEDSASAPKTDTISSPPACTCDPKDDTVCAHAVCDPATQKCGLLPFNNGAACEDDDPCTHGDRCDKGACKAGSASWCQCAQTSDCAALEDGDACNGTLYCDQTTFPWACRVAPSSVPTCNDDAGPCAAPGCDATTGECTTVPKPNKTPCDDGDSCTANDVCHSGKCEPGGNSCVCKSQQDCAAKDDANLCNGQLFCDLAAGACKLNPASVVTCNADSDTDCVHNTCDQTTGICGPKATTAGSNCDDGDACTEGEKCSGGVCGGATNVCKCTSNSDCASKDDGDLCNGTLFCKTSDGTCHHNPATLVSCPEVDNTACLKNACQPKTGKCAMTDREKAKKTCVDGQTDSCEWTVLSDGAPAAKNVACDDGDACTTGDVCGSGKCQPGTFTCTCAADSDCATQDDGDLCNGTLFCNKAATPAVCALNPTTVVKCQTVDDTDCLKASCAPKTGKCALAAVASGALCDDGNACTKNDVCIFGKCNAGTLVCACQTNADCAGKDDGNLCNGTWYCDKSGDKPACTFNSASTISCPQNLGQCATNVCNPATGQCQAKFAAKDKSCDDGGVCTEKAACIDGACKPVAIKKCDDSNLCTVDSCDPKSGCRNEVANCVDGNACTADKCDAKTGKCGFDAAALDGKACDGDGSPCTVNDVCKLGVCKIGQKIVCNLPTKACEQAACVAAAQGGFQCVVTDATEDTACDDGNACTTASACKSGKCSGAGKEAFFTATITPKTSENGRFRRSTTLASGGWIGVGGAWDGLQGSPKKSTAWIQRLDAAGAASWSLELTSAHASKFVEAVELVDQGSHFLVATTTAKDSNKRHVGVVAVSTAGVAMWTKHHASGGADTTAQALVGHSDGGATVVGTRQSGSNSDGWLTRVKSNGDAVWATTLSRALPDWLSDAALLSDAAGHNAAQGQSGDGVVAVGWTESGLTKPRAAWIVRVNSEGKAVWQRDLGTSGESSALQSIAARADDSLVAAGSRTDKSGAHTLLVAISAGGQPLWERVAPTLDTATGIAMGGSGSAARAVTVGRAKTGTKEWSLQLLGHDPLGNRHWTQKWPSPGSELPAHVAQLADGGLVVAGQVVVAGKSRGLFVRSDGWGASSCAKSGVCGGKKIAACDDGKPCTADRCDGTKGCVHTVAAGMTCAPGDPCETAGLCKSGACKANGKPALFAKLLDAGKELHDVGGVAALPGGDVAIGATRQKRTWQVTRVTASGVPVWQREWVPEVNYGQNDKALPGVTSIAAAPDGGMAVLGSWDTKADYGVMTMRRLNHGGDVVWTWPGAQKTVAGEPGQVFAYPDGTGFVMANGAFGTVTRVSDGDAKLGGKTVWTVNLKHPYNYIYAPRAALLPNQTLITAYQVVKLSGKTSTINMLYTAISAAGTIAWQITEPLQTQRAVAGATVTKDGVVFGGTWPHPAGYPQRWLSAVSATGKLLWSRESGQNRDLDALASTPAGFAAIGGVTVSTGAAGLLVSHFGVAGALLQTTELADASAALEAARHTPLVTAADGAIVVVGRTNTAGADKLFGKCQHQAPAGMEGLPCGVAKSCLQGSARRTKRTWC